MQTLSARSSKPERASRWRLSARSKSPELRGRTLGPDPAHRHPTRPPNRRRRARRQRARRAPGQISLSWYEQNPNRRFGSRRFQRRGRNATLSFARLRTGRSVPRTAPTNPMAERAAFAGWAPGQPKRRRKRRAQQPIQVPRRSTRALRKARTRSRNRRRLLGPERNARSISARAHTPLSVPQTAPISPTTADRAASASDKPPALPRAGGTEGRPSFPDQCRIARAGKASAVPGYPDHVCKRPIYWRTRRDSNSRPLPSEGKTADLRPSEQTEPMAVN